MPVWAADLKSIEVHRDLAQSQIGVAGDGERHKAVADAVYGDDVERTSWNRLDFGSKPF